MFNILQGCSLCMTTVTSMVTTLLIGAQVYSSTSLNPRARRRYKPIIEIMLQSSALYSLAILTQAIVTLMSPGSFDKMIIVTGDYTQVMVNITMVCDIYTSNMYIIIDKTTDLGLCTHSYGCSSVHSKRWFHGGLFNRRQLWATGWNVEQVSSFSTVEQRLRNAIKLHLTLELNVERQFIDQIRSRDPNTVVLANFHSNRQAALQQTWSRVQYFQQKKHEEDSKGNSYLVRRFWSYQRTSCSSW